MSLIGPELSGIIGNYRNYCLTEIIGAVKLSISCEPYVRGNEVTRVQIPSRRNSFHLALPMELSMREQLNEASKANNNNDDDDDNDDSRSNRSDSNKSSDKMVANNVNNSHINGNGVIINSNSCDVINKSHSDDVINNGTVNSGSSCCLNGDVNQTSPVPAQDAEPLSCPTAPRRAPKLSALRASSNGAFSKPLVMTR